MYPDDMRVVRKTDTLLEVTADMRYAVLHDFPNYAGVDGRAYKRDSLCRKIVTYRRIPRLPPGEKIHEF